MITAHINMGSNIDRIYQLSNALNKLKYYFLSLTCSSVYESEAVGFEGCNFYNLGVNIKTLLSIEKINQILYQIENQHGRGRSQPKFSSRKIDLDLILYGHTIDINHNIPRDDILKYSFVLAPLVELMPDTIHPVERVSFKKLWQVHNKQALKKYTLRILGDAL